MSSSSKPNIEEILKAGSEPGASTHSGGGAESPKSPRSPKPEEKPNFSLRGSASKSTGTDPGFFGDPKIRALMTEREIRITFNALPTRFESFPDWWFQAERAILAAGPDP